MKLKSPLTLTALYASSALYAFFLSGCVATREDVASLETQIERLEKNMATMEKKQVELSSQLDGIKSPVMSLNSNLSDTQNLLANFTPRFEELRAQLEGIRKDLNQKVADLASRLTETSEQLEGMGKKLENKLAEIRKAQAAKPPAAPAGAKNEKPPAKNGGAPTKKNDSSENGAPVDSSSSNGSPLGTFQSAYKDYLAGRYDLAEAGFTNYLESEPDGSLADKSLYYSALSAKAKGNTAKAAERLDQVADRFPKSPVVRSALLEKAKIFIQDKRNAEAEGILEYLSITYPKSPEAAEAKKLLEKLPH